MNECKIILKFQIYEEKFPKKFQQPKIELICVKPDINE